MFDQLGSAILAKPVPTAIAELVRQIEPAKVARLRLGSAHTAAETLAKTSDYRGPVSRTQRCEEMELHSGVRCLRAGHVVESFRQ